MVPRPLVSIIMPLYNAESFLNESVGSILSQTYDNWELIVIEDCSSDGSLSLARDFEKQDGRITVYRNKRNLGAAKSRNEGLKFVSGDYVAFIDADDAWFPEKLERQLCYMNKAGLGMCFTSYETVECDGAHRNYVHVPTSIDYSGF